MSSTVSIDTLFVRHVIQPWQEQCRDAEYPWEATPELRHHWARMIQQGDPLEREIGALALMRTAGLTQGETTLLNHFWSRSGFVTIPLMTALEQALLGASPPLFLSLVFFKSIRRTDLKTSPDLQALLSLATRHPANAPVVDLLAERTSFYVHGNVWGLNPGLHPDRVDPLFALPSLWFRAGALFNPVIPFAVAKTQVREGRNLDQVALLLRPTLTCDEYNTVLNLGLPTDDFLFLTLEHPASRGEVCPPIEWTNPSLDCIHWFSEQSLVCMLWRLWNPLLSLPWLTDDPLTELDPGFALCRLLLGLPLACLTDPSIYDYAQVRYLVKRYPEVLGCP